MAIFIGVTPILQGPLNIAFFEQKVKHFSPVLSHENMCPFWHVKDPFPCGKRVWKSRGKDGPWGGAL
ncbi:MAG: hypothetical protein A3J08_02000 [Candidatus Lloydbacteria bacterium RIFCSPLOWO2_02_FULL_51_11]|uniref:Uncharacterized protein n=1 Tax=Candidatus Lloydbacteria bacterium RIFCSPLOWO2_02_FULL_51_11 TaxID=1798667 RepID=A0A1G2DMA2_9BACT|nr:MAG: hypothetical protein A3J08_02000 [Candidatus Lloydbacteria bacterium RIFCSPLOWO2_02_FULL_51_11]